MIRLRSIAARPALPLRPAPAGRLPLIALLCGAVAIAFAPIFVRLSPLEPTATAFHRLFLALPVLWLWLAVEQGGRPGGAPIGARIGAPIGAPIGARPGAPIGARLDRADLIGLGVCGLFFAGDLAFWHWSIRYTSIANATLLANFAPVFVALAGFLLYGERFSRTFLMGMAVALAGACVLMGRSIHLSAENALGDALGLITAVFYAGYIVSVGRLRARLSTATIMAGSGLVTCAALLPIALVSGEALIPGTAAGWLVLLGLALVSHCGGQSLIAFALAHLPAAFSSVSLLLQPAVAAGLAWVLLGEALGWVQGTGALAILAGIALARRGSREAPVTKPSPSGGT